MTNFSTSQIGRWDSLHILISGLFKYGYPNISCSKAGTICKIKRIVNNIIPLGYVNNYDKNRYLEKKSESSNPTVFSVRFRWLSNI